MKKIFLVIAGLLLLCASAQATILLSDDFNTEAYGLSYETGGQDLDNWIVTNGTIDVIGEGTPFNLTPGTGNGLYLDLDGSTRDAGRVTSDLLFGPGTYIISYDLAGSRRGDVNALAVTFGDYFNGVVMGSSDGWTTFTETVTLASAANLIFDHAGGDNIGLLLDNVVVETAPVPEPATMMLFGIGLLGLAGVSRRKK